MTHGPIEEQHRASMNKVAQVLDGIFKGYGFMLLVFPLNEMNDARMNYISSADRTDMIAAMREFIAASEGRVHDAPGAKQ